MLGNSATQRLSLHQEAQFHVQVHGELGQVGAGDEEAIAVGEGAFGVESSLLTVVIDGPLLRRPDIGAGVSDEGLLHLRDLVEAEPSVAFRGGFEDEMEKHAA